jgi:hypothetical protein
VKMENKYSNLQHETVNLREHGSTNAQSSRRPHRL